MPSTLRSASALAALWQCQRCNHTNTSAKNKRCYFSCRAWRDGVLRQGRATTASVTLYGTIWYYFTTPSPPPPIAHASSCVACYRCLPSAACHPPPIICCLLSSQNLPPNLVDCRCRHRPLLLYCLPCQHYDIAPTVVAVMPRRRSCERLMLMSMLASTAFALRHRPLV